MLIAATIISNQGGYYASRPCGQLDFMFKGDYNDTLSLFPGCEAFYSGENLDQYTLVRADMAGESVANVAAAIGMGFGPATWLAFAIHAIGIEIYVSCHHILGESTDCPFWLVGYNG